MAWQAEKAEAGGIVVAPKVAGLLVSLLLVQINHQSRLEQTVAKYINVSGERRKLVYGKEGNVTYEIGNA